MFFAWYGLRENYSYFPTVKIELTVVESLAILLIELSLPMIRIREDIISFSLSRCSRPDLVTLFNMPGTFL